MSFWRLILPDALFAAHDAEIRARAAKLEADTRALQEARRLPWLNTPKDVTYEIVIGDDLKPGDIIIHRGGRFVISECGPGFGAGTDDYGQYVWVRGHHRMTKTPDDFWLCQASPTIKVVPVSYP